MPPIPPSRQLYDRLSKDPRYKGIGNSYESFVSYFSQPSNAQKLYGNLSKDTRYKGVGKDFNSFATYFQLGHTGNNDTPAPAPQPPAPAPMLPPSPIAQAVHKDTNNSNLGAVYNKIIGSFERFAKGGVDAVEAVHRAALELRGTPMPADQPRRSEKMTPFFDALRTDASSRQHEEKVAGGFDLSDGFGKKDIKSILIGAPATVVDMAGGAYTGGSSFFLQSFADGNAELDKLPEAKKLTDVQRLGYLTAQGAVQAALEKVGVDKVLKSTGLGKTAIQKLTSTVTKELIERGTKATAKEIEAMALRQATTFAAQLKRVGAKAATSFLTEGTTEALQAGASDGIKLLTNKASGKEVFDGEDIARNFVKNMTNAGVQGGLVGGLLGGGMEAMQHTKKAIRKEVSKAVTPQDIAKIQQDVNSQVQDGTLTPEEGTAANASVQKYADLSAALPAHATEEQKYALMGAAEQHEALQNAIADAKAEKGNVAAAYHPAIDARIELLEGKLGEVKDYQDEIISGKQYTYTEKNGKYFKVMDGEETPITQPHYDLAMTIRRKDATIKTYDDLNAKEKDGIVVPKEYGAAEVKVQDNGEGEKTFTPVAYTKDMKGGLEIKNNLKLEDKTYKDKDKALAAAEKALAQHYYENGMQEHSKPVVIPEAPKVKGEPENITQPIELSTGSTTLDQHSKRR
jgi:hypothetical protein